MRLGFVFWLMTAQVWGQPAATHVDVFRAGEGGYAAYRIPAIVTAADGTLLAFAEARKENRGDPGGGDIDLVMSRSTDSGATWSAMVVVDDPGEKWAASNPTPLLDRSNGRLWLFYNRWEPGFGTVRSQPGTRNNQMWARTSEDHGLTWSEARDLTRESRNVEEWGAMFLGPGGAIQTRSGRLLVPAAMKPDAYSVLGETAKGMGPVGLMRAYALISDDHGRSWRRGALIGALTNENQLVELADGRILMDARQNAGEHRWLITSVDGGVSWETPRPGMTMRMVATGIERLPDGRLLWTGPALPGRLNLVARLSGDGGETWPVEVPLYEGFSAYSDITLLATGEAGVLWERGEKSSYEAVSFLRLPREVLK